MRFINLFSGSDQADLAKYLCDKSLLARERRRFVAIQLSSRAYSNVERSSVDDLVEILSVSRTTILKWFDRYDKGGLAALLDSNMSHKKSTLATIPTPIILDSVAISPQNLAGAVAHLSNKYYNYIFYCNS